MRIFEALQRHKSLVVIAACVAAGLAAVALTPAELLRNEAMRNQKTKAALERHWSDPEDQAVVHEIYHDDVVVEFPQSGERILGRANLRAMREAYPARISFTVQQSRGGGDLWVTELVVTYDGKKEVNAVSIMEFRRGKVSRETLYFGDPWEPPAWRAQWVEQER